MPLEKGTKAPNFTLKTKTAEGLKELKLSDHFGKKATVLLFFPASFTNVCTEEMCHLEDQGLPSNLPNAEVWAISVDSPFAQEAWAIQNKLNVTLLSDYKREVSKLYGVLLPDLAGLGPASARAAFVIDKEGLICYSEQTPTPLELPNFKAIHQVLSTCS